MSWQKSWLEFPAMGLLSTSSTIWERLRWANCMPLDRRQLREASHGI